MAPSSKTLLYGLLLLIGVLLLVSLSDANREKKPKANKIKVQKELIELKNRMLTRERDFEVQAVQLDQLLEKNNELENRLGHLQNMHQVLLEQIYNFLGSSHLDDGEEYVTEKPLPSTTPDPSVANISLSLVAEETSHHGISTGTFQVDDEIYVLFPARHSCVLKKFHGGSFHTVERLTTGTSISDCIHCEIEGEHYILLFQLLLPYMHYFKLSGKTFHRWSERGFDYYGKTYISRRTKHVQCFSVENDDDTKHFLSMVYNYDSLHDVMYWNGFEYVHFQQLPPAHASTPFTMHGETYLIQAMRYWEHATPEQIFHYNKNTDQFELFQTLVSDGEHSSSVITYFEIGGNSFLGVPIFSMNEAGIDQHVSQSLVYKYDTATGFFELYQGLDSVRPTMMCPFHFGYNDYLIIANTWEGYGHDIKASLYWFNGINFVSLGLLPTRSTEFCEAFKGIDQQQYLLFSHGRDLNGRFDQSIFKVDYPYV